MKSVWICLSILLSTSVASARSLDLIYKNNEGVRHFKKEKHLEAYESFMELTAQDPYDLTLQFNMGAALASNGEEQKAMPLYKGVLKSVDEKLKTAKTPEEQQELLKIKFALLYNLGVHFQITKEPEEALKYYQQALELLPESREIKTNIEMMFSGGGNGKGEGDPNKQEKGEGEGEGSKQDEPKEGEKDPKKDQQQGEKPKDPKKEFDQNQMSMEDLERIMDELKQQEQNIRAKVNKKGGKNEPKEKQW